MMTVLNTLVALAIPWYAGILITATLLPSVPLLGRVGIGWGIGLGGLTWLMVGLSVIHIPITGAVVGLALLLCVLGFAWFAPQSGSGLPLGADQEQRDAAPSWWRWSMIAFVGFILTISAIWNAV